MLSPFAGALLGGLVGNLNSSDCGNEPGDFFCGFATPAGVVLGAVAGGLFGLAVATSD